MAHTEKFKRAAASQLGAHIDRLREGGHSYGNENIDASRSHLNYDLSGCKTPLSVAVADAVKGSPRTVRKDAVLLGSTTTTLPKNWPTDRDPREFFEAVRGFDLGFWPRSYVEVRATVHMDETTPHLHHVFIPLDASGQPNFNGTYKRDMYRSYHEEMARSVRGALGLPDLRITIPDEERGERAMHKLSQRDYKAAKAEERAVQERLERLRSEADALEPAKESVVESARYIREHQEDGGREEALGRELEGLREREAGLGREVAEVRGAVERAEARVRVQEGELEGLGGRLRAAERALEVLRAAVGRLAARFRMLGGRVAGSVSAGHARHARALADEAVSDEAERLMRNRRDWSWHR